MPTVRESSHVSRKYVSHGGSAISGQGHSNNSANSLENNLDALLEDLQTSVSRSATPSAGRKTISPLAHVDYKTVITPINKTFIETRTDSPIRTTSTTMKNTEKYVSTTPAGFGSGIPGLETLDAELRNVQPGQAKTVAYKQVSYQYNKSQDGQKIESFGATDNTISNKTKSLHDNVHETAYEETYRRPRSPEKSSTKKTINRELVYGDNNYSSYSNKGTNYLSEPKPQNLSSSYTTHECIEKHGSDLNHMALPEHLVPGPNTKVTKTVKTYTYEVPGTPETYRRQPVELSPGHNDHSELTQKSSLLHKEAKYYQEDFHKKPVSPLPINYETTTTKKENFYIRDERYENGYIPVDRVDYPILKSSQQQHQQQQQQQPPLTETTTTTVIDRLEEFIPDNKTIVTENQHSYYSAPPQTSPPVGVTSSVYKYSKETHSDREVLLPKPFPTGTQLYPVNGHGPPKRLDDLMASFSDSEREVLVDISREKKIQRTERIKENVAPKKEVEFIPHTPPQVNSKNIAGPPVYYPPGSGEFKMKEESAMIQGGGEWAKARGAYEYETASKSKKTQKSGKAVVPVCLPLCCALPCVIM